MTKNEYFFMFQQKLQDVIGFNAYIKNCIKITKFFNDQWAQGVSCSPEELANKIISKLTIR